MTMRSELAGSDPVPLFHTWLQAATLAEPNDPSAAALATASPDGEPTVRMVLIKVVDAAGFRFYTNAESQKGTQLEHNPRAALCFHWKSLRRQVRVTGPVRQLPEQESAFYFHQRSRRSQIGAAVSLQSRPLADRTTLEEQVARFEHMHPGDEVPKPAFWCGYLLEPQTVEFWIDGADRLHDRRLFTRADGSWTSTLLYP